MPQTATQTNFRRYKNVEAKKAKGATYTPDNLALFVAEKMVEQASVEGRESISILDPAIGDGVLVLALLKKLTKKTNATITVYGFDTDPLALTVSAQQIHANYPKVELQLKNENFLDYILKKNDYEPLPLFARAQNSKFDLIIANPPYVRTQIMGAERARQLAHTFGLSGRVDLYHAFLLGITRVLAPDGTAGLIVSNRFMTTKGGSALRSALRQRFKLCHIWDLGDTKLFDAAVLPAVIVARGAAVARTEMPQFTSIYEVKSTFPAPTMAVDPLDALKYSGIVTLADGRHFCVRHGFLDSSTDDQAVWRLASQSADEWLATVNRHTWKRFGEIGKIRVGVKTCADKIFIRHDWESAFGSDIPELLRPLITHHVAGRFRAITLKQQRAILYPHEVKNGKRQAVPLEKYPKSRAYLERHRATLENRTYLIEAGRRWYEIWVPQDPQAWAAPKLVFRDIAERPTFWIDFDGSVVNGDCYWLALTKGDADLLWLACAVANSTFAEAFYDHRFNNKLYAGRRRFITQYVEQFPLPDPTSPLSRNIVACAKAIYDANHSKEAKELEFELDQLVWEVFGLSIEKVSREVYLKLRIQNFSSELPKTCKEILTSC